jgi:hypothetical protein
VWCKASETLDRGNDRSWTLSLNHSLVTELITTLLGHFTSQSEILLPPNGGNRIPTADRNDSRVNSTSIPPQSQMGGGIERAAWVFVLALICGSVLRWCSRPATRVPAYCVSVRRRRCDTKRPARGLVQPGCAGIRFDRYP